MVCSGRRIDRAQQTPLWGDQGRAAANLTREGECVIISAMRAGVRAVTYLAFGSLVLAGTCTTAGASTALSPPIKVHVSLDRHRAVAGQSIKGSVVLTNTTAKDITVETCARNGWLTVGLSGRVNAYSFVHTAIGCVPTTRIVPGPNRFGVTVNTTFVSCTQPRPCGNPPTPTSRPAPSGSASSPWWEVFHDGQPRRSHRPHAASEPGRRRARLTKASSAARPLCRSTQCRSAAARHGPECPRGKRAHRSTCDGQGLLERGVRQPRGHSGHLRVADARVDGF